jgi:hypothetical protein
MYVNDLHTYIDYLSSVCYLCYRCTGFGDINCSNTTERAFAVWGIIIGASTFGYILGNVTSIMESFNVEVSKTDTLKLLVLLKHTALHCSYDVMCAAACIPCKAYDYQSHAYISVYTQKLEHVSTVQRGALYACSACSTHFIHTTYTLCIVCAASPCMIKHLTKVLVYIYLLCRILLRSKKWIV